MKYLAILGVAAFAIACDSPTSPSTAASVAPASRVANAVITNDKFESVTGAPNNCDGSFLVLTATWHTLFAITFDGAGGFHVKQHVNVQGQGSDAATGVDYVVAKFGAIATILFAFSFLPQVVLFVGNMLVSDSALDYFTGHLWVLWKVPVAVAILFAFNAGRSRTTWQGFSLRWFTGDRFGSVLHDPDLQNALKHSGAGRMPFVGGRVQQPLG